MTTPALTPDDIRAATRRYLAGLIALVVLTALAVGVVARIEDGNTRAVAALGIAAVEAALALTLFMRITAERWVIYGSLALTAICLAAALALPIWSERDHITGTHHRMWDAGVAAPAGLPHTEVTPADAGAGGVR